MPSSKAPIPTQAPSRSPPWKSSIPPPMRPAKPIQHGWNARARQPPSCSRAGPAIARGVHFDLWKGEACVDPLIPAMVDNMKAKGIAELDEGALIVRVQRPEDKKEIPPLILVKRDGAAMYSTTDLATIVDRVNEQNP